MPKGKKTLAYQAKHSRMNLSTHSGYHDPVDTLSSDSYAAYHEDAGTLPDAVARGDFKRVEAEIAAGADVDAYGYDGASPLAVAIMKNWPAMARILLGAGACTVLRPDKLCALHLAAVYKSVEILRMIVIENLRRNLVHDCHICKATTCTMAYLAAANPGSCFSQMLALLLASGQPTGWRRNEQEAYQFDDTRDALAVAAIPRTIAEACTDRILGRAAFDLARERMTTICFGLQPLQLPALLTTMILEEACTPPGANLLFHHMWSVATIVKHRRVR